MYENGWVQKKDGTGKGHMVWQLWIMSQLFISILMKQKIIVNGIKKNSYIKEWELAAYTEFRLNNKDGYKFKKSYPYPTGENTLGLIV